ncbi:hypothetical protein Hanom_Chr12g01158291 [Helianthus anomalus]
MIYCYIMDLHFTNSIINLYIYSVCFSFSNHVSQCSVPPAIFLRNGTIIYRTITPSPKTNKLVSQNFTLNVPWICATSLPPLILIIIASTIENQVIDLSFVSSHNHTLLTSYNCLMILMYRAGPSLGPEIFKGP